MRSKASCGVMASLSSEDLLLFDTHDAFVGRADELQTAVGVGQRHARTVQLQDLGGLIGQPIQDLPDVVILGNGLGIVVENPEESRKLSHGAPVVRG